MVLSRDKQNLQEYHPELGITEFMVKLAKGKMEDKNSYWFYYLFLNRRNFNVPDEAQDMIQVLQDAWWVEEEDVEQEVRKIIVENKIQLTDRGRACRTISKHLKDWLIVNQKIFSRSSEWESKLVSEFAHTYERVGINILFDNPFFVPVDKYLTKFEIYLIYLMYVVELEQCDLHRIFIDTKTQVCDFVQTLREKIKENNNGSKNPD